MTFVTEITAGNRIISERQKPFLIAELGLNHNADTATAKAMITAARECGADAVKFQSYTTDLFINPEEEKCRFLADIFRRYELSFDAHLELQAFAAEQGILFFTTPLSLDWLGKAADLDLPLIKIASGDLNNFLFLEKLTALKKPLIISTGASTRSEINRAAEFLRAKKYSQVIFLHCVSRYPTPVEAANLATIGWLRTEFQCLTGFSDHTEGEAAAAAAVALGAVVIEKHFTLDKNMEGPDQKLSADPVEMKKIRAAMDLAFTLRGEVRDQAQPEEIAGDYYGKRSLYSVKGETIPMRPRREDLPKDSDYRPA